MDVVILVNLLNRSLYNSMICYLYQRILFNFFISSDRKINKLGKKTVIFIAGVDYLFVDILDNFDKGFITTSK